MSTQLLKQLCAAALVLSTTMFSLACASSNPESTSPAPTGSNYYVDSIRGSDDNKGTSEESPWQTFSKISGTPFQPGDNIYFKRGSSYTGVVYFNDNGTPDDPITISSYGTGDTPAFTNPDFSLSCGNAFNITGDYVIVDGLYFHGTAAVSGNGRGDTLNAAAVFVAKGADHVTVRNCEFNDCAIGVTSAGLHTLITGSNFHDFKRWLDPPGWGPLGVVIASAYAEISYNTFSNIYTVGGSFGADGGAIELDDRFFDTSTHDVKIHHNMSSYNYGFLEVEGKVVGNNLDVSYNVSNDYQEFIFYWGGHDSKVENNTVIRTLPPLGDPPSVNTVFGMAYSWGEGKTGPFTVRNNIFVVGNGVQVWVDAPYDARQGYASAVKENNIYYSADESTNDPHGLTLGPGEMILDPGFVNLSGKDYHLTSGSPAVDAGQNLGYTSDAERRIVPNGSAPDIGAYEH